MNLFATVVLMGLSRRQEQLGLCPHCMDRAFTLHCKEHNARGRGAVLFPLTALRIGLLRWWTSSRLDVGRSRWRDLYLWMGAADSYSRVIRTNSLAAQRTA